MENNNNSENLLTKDSQGANLLKLFENILVPTALISAIGYYLGWTASAAYYLSFGLSPSFITKSFEEFLAFAWVELVFGVACITLGIIIYRVLDELLETKKRRSLLVTFYTSLFLSIASMVTYFILTNYTRNYELIDRLKNLAFFLASILFAWIATVIGKFIRERHSSKGDKSKQPFFRVIFPSFYIYTFVTMMMLVVALGRIAATRGLYIGLRDSRNPETLPHVTIYSSTQLPLQGRLDSSLGLYVYDECYFVDSNDDLLFIVSPTISPLSTSTFTTHTISVDKDLILELTPPETR